MSECERCQELFDRYVVDQLTEQEKIFVEKHLADCATCVEALAQWQGVEQMLTLWAAEEIEPPADFRAKLFEKLEKQSFTIMPIPAQKSWFKQNKRKLMPLAVAVALMLTLMPTIWHNLKADAQMLPKASENRMLAQDNATVNQDKQNMPDVAQKSSLDQITPDHAAGGDLQEQSTQPEQNAPSPQTPENQPMTTPTPVPADAASSATPPAVKVPETVPQPANSKDAEPQLAQLPAPAAYMAGPTPRSALPEAGDIDWAGYKTSTEQELQQLQEQLAQLREAKDQPVTEETAQQIKELEKVIRQIEARLKAIEDRNMDKVEASFDVE